MSRIDADDLMLRYDLAAQRYRLAVRLNAGVEEAFLAWNALREELIAKLAGEAS